MQDRTYSDLLFLVQSLIGAGNLTTEEQGSIDSFINRRAHEAFQTSQSWPRFLVSSEERLLGLYKLSNASTSTSILVNQSYRFLGISSGSNTIPGTNVYQGVTTGDSFSTSGLPKGTVALDVAGGRVVQFTEADTVKNDSIENVTTWTPRADLDQLKVVTQNLIPYSQTAIQGILDNVGEFLKVYRKKAFLNDSSLEYDFFVDSKGANILNAANATDNAAFVTYKKELPQYTITSTDIPGEWFFFIAHGSYADFLRMEGQIEKALIEEETAQKYLAMELEKVDNMSNNNVFRRFSTHGTRQSR